MLISPNAPRKGFTIRQVGIGDGIQFTSLPENYHRATGQRLIDVTKPWYLDHNPYVDRNVPCTSVTELWNYPQLYPYPKVRDSVWMSNAEIHAAVMGVLDPQLIRPRLYRFEDFPYHKRELILFHPYGKSHGALPDKVIGHVINKYRPTGMLIQVGAASDPALPIPRIQTDSLWDLARIISECRLFIGVDSGPSWIAACYPDVQIKKIRTKFQFDYCPPKDWVPLDVRNPHSFWDDQNLFTIYNTFEDDCGFTQSYKKI